ncbi:MAG: cell division protein FtsZ [Patescibacteria group bacterium]
MVEIKPDIETCAKIKVVGVGGGGGSAISRMIAMKLRGIDFIAVNTDAQALHANPAPVKVPIGKTVTRGLGAGMNPEVGRRAAEENANDIRNAIAGADMVFLTCGLGGGTGSGVSPEVAKIARETGALTVAVVTKPFSFEGAQRKRIAEEAYQELSQHVDTIITIPNDRVLQIIDKKTSLLDAFKIVDDILRQGVQGIAEIITLPGLINVDFADVKAIMSNAGSALMGIGHASGENRAVEAAKQAIASPLLEISIDGAKGILFTVTGGPDLAMYEVAEAAKVITGSADDDARVIFGANIDENLGDEVRITVVATGFDSHEARRVPSLAGDVEIAPRSVWSPTPVSRREDFRGPSRVANPFEAPFEARKVPQYSVTPIEQQNSSFSEHAADPIRQKEPQRNDSESSSRFHEQMLQDRLQQPQSTTSLPVQNPTVKVDDDDFGIPAFIRRKMM